MTSSREIWRPCWLCSFIRFSLSSREISEEGTWLSSSKLHHQVKVDKAQMKAGNSRLIWNLVVFAGAPGACGCPGGDGRVPGVGKWRSGSERPARVGDGGPMLQAQWKQETMATPPQNLSPIQTLEPNEYCLIGEPPKQNLYDPNPMQGYRQWLPCQLTEWVGIRSGRIEESWYFNSFQPRWSLSLCVSAAESLRRTWVLGIL